MDPHDGIIMIKKFIYHLDPIPNYLHSMDALALHIVSKDLAETFEVGLICLFLEVPNKPGFMHKYTCRHNIPDLIDMRTHNSLASEVMKFGRIVIVNNLRHVSYNASVDGVNGMKVSKILSVPLKHQVTNQVIGVMHFINRGFTNEDFGEVDEFFASLFASQLQSLLTSCDVYHRNDSKVELYSKLMRLPTELNCAIPKVETTESRRKLSHGEIISAIETVLKDTSQCYQVKAFLVSSPFIGMEYGSLIFNDNNQVSTPAPMMKIASTLGGEGVGVGSTIRSRRKSNTGNISSEMSVSNINGGGESGLHTNLSSLSSSSSINGIAITKNNSSSFITKNRPYSKCGIAGSMLMSEASNITTWMEIDNISLNKKYNNEIDVDDVNGYPVVVLPVLIAKGYGLEAQYPNNSVVAIIEFTLSPISPPLYPRINESNKKMSFPQALCFVKQLITPTLTQLLACVLHEPLPTLISKPESLLPIPNQSNIKLGLPEKIRRINNTLPNNILINKKMSMSMQSSSTSDNMNNSNSNTGMRKSFNAIDELNEDNGAEDLFQQHLALKAKLEELKQENETLKHNLEKSQGKGKLLMEAHTDKSKGVKKEEELKKMLEKITDR